MGWIFDNTMVQAGNGVQISYANSRARGIIGTVAGVFGNILVIEHFVRGRRHIAVVSADEVGNGAANFRWTLADGTRKQYPNDPVVIESTGSGISSQPTTSSFAQTFSNATFDGEVNAIEMRFNTAESIVSFWGYATQTATGTTRQAFVILDPAIYPLLQRFQGQVDQFAIGYNSGTGDFKYTPLRITADSGFELVTAPNISVGTRFSFQFVLILAT